MRYKITFLFIIVLLIIIGVFIYRHSRQIKADEVGPQISLQGKIKLLHGHVMTTGTEKDEYDLLTDKNTIYKLILPPQLKIHITSGLVTVTGKLKGSEFIVSTIEDSSKKISAQSVEQGNITLPPVAPLSVATGTKKMAVLIFGFADKKGYDFTKDDLKKILFKDSNSMRAYFQEVSYGKLDFTGDVFDELDYQVPTTECKTKPGYYFFDQAKNIAKISGINLDSYDRIAIVWNYDCFGVGGVASDHDVVIAPMPSDQLVVTLSHELIHTFSYNETAPEQSGGRAIYRVIDHANTLSCVGEDGTIMPISTKCTPHYYGDVFDIMGGGYVNDNKEVATHVNSYFKAFFQWLPSENIIHVTQSGTYHLKPVEQKLAGTQLIIIDRKATPLPIPGVYTKDSAYYLEFRQPFGFDNVFDPITDTYKGLMIRLAPKPDEYTASSDLQGLATYLVNTKDSSGSYHSAILLPGQIFVDPTGIHIKTISVSHDELVVNVCFGNDTSLCQSDPPNIDPPNAPTNLKQTIKKRNVKLTWNDNSINESGFVLERSSSQSFVNPQTIDVSSNATTWNETIPSKPQKAKFYYRIRSYLLNDKNQRIYSSYSNSVKVQFD